MAAFPCDAHGGPAHGRLTTFYPALIQDGIRKTNKRRLCMDCARDLLYLHKEDWEDGALPSKLKEQVVCSGCGAEQSSNGDLSRFFCTAYLDGKTRRDYSGSYCPACTSSVLREFALDG